VSQLHDRTLALAGILQAARLAQQWSREGRADPAAFGASVRSVLMIDAASVADVYGGAHGVALGLTLVRDKLGGNGDARDVEMAKYVAALMQLEGALARRTDVTRSVQDGIRALAADAEIAEAPAADAALAELAEKLSELYTRTLSTLSPRIMVTGEQGFLAKTSVAAGVRAALFAGVRSAALWRQLDGRRWRLLVQRARLTAAAAELIGARRA
jgi:high frequency lysogenization protein